MSAAVTSRTDSFDAIPSTDSRTVLPILDCASLLKSRLTASLLQSSMSDGLVILLRWFFQQPQMTRKRTSCPEEHVYRHYQVGVFTREPYLQ